MELTTILTNFWQGFVYAVITFVFIIAAKKIADFRTTKFDDDLEIRENKNLAIGFRRTGLYIAYAIAFAGTLGSEGTGFGQDVLAFIADGVLITICLFACRTINDKILLAKIANDDEALKGNNAVGLSECGMYIATGFVLNGAFSGTSVSIFSGLTSALVFFVIGQAALLILGMCYEFITPYNVNSEIKNGNTSAGVAMAGMLISLGIILRASIAGPSIGWAADFITFGFYTLFGIVLLLIFRLAIDIFLLPKTTLSVEVEEKKNVASLMLTEAGIIAIAIIISAVI